jgi:hypothetical protein
MGTEDKSSWMKEHKVLSSCGALVVLGIIGLIILSSTNLNVNKTPANTTNVNTLSNNSSAKSSPTATAAPVAKVGDTVDIGGSNGLAVTLLKVIDPAQGADQQFNTPDAGKRFVGVDVKIANNNSSAYHDNANTDMIVIGSDNQTYTADYFDSVSECTDFNSGEYTLAGSESATGCVVFQVPTGVSVAKVQFTSNEGLGSDVGEWLVG